MTFDEILNQVVRESNNEKIDFLKNSLDSIVNLLFPTDIRINFEYEEVEDHHRVIVYHDQDSAITYFHSKEDLFTGIIGYCMGMTWDDNLADICNDGMDVLNIPSKVILDNLIDITTRMYEDGFPIPNVITYSIEDTLRILRQIEVVVGNA